MYYQLRRKIILILPSNIWNNFHKTNHKMQMILKSTEFKCSFKLQYFIGFYFSNTAGYVQYLFMLFTQSFLPLTLCAFMLLANI